MLKNYFCENIILTRFTYTENDTESHENIKMTNYNTKYTKNTQIHFQQSIFSKYKSVGIPGPLQTAFELKN